MRTLKALFESENGIVLAISLLILTMLIAGGMGAVFSTQMDLNTSANLRTGKLAFYIAEAGLHQAWQQLDNDNGRNDFETVFNAQGPTTLLSNVGFVGGNYTVIAEGVPGSRPKRIKAISTSCFPAGNPCSSGHSRVVIEAQFRREPLFPCVLCAREGVMLSGGAVTDSYDSREAPYSIATAGHHGDVKSNRDITVSGVGTLVKGDAAAGGTVSTSGGAAIIGDATNNALPLGFPPAIPCGPPFSSGAGVVGGSYDPSTGQLRGTGSDAIILANGTYCFSSVELTGNSSLTVNGPITLYLTAPSSFAAGGIINTTANAESLKIVSSFSSSELGITVSGGAQVYMTLYAPNARVEITGAGDLYGAIVGRSIANTSGARFHYDRKLKDSEDGRLKMVVWKEAL
jgi:hypothetical protein